MKEIPLTKNECAIVDDEDYERLSKFKWYLNSEGYALRDIWNGGKRIRVRMHREIINVPKGMDTDHINGNRKDNQKSNLRICTRSQNVMNCSKRKNTSSIYKGVCYHRFSKLWHAVINIGKRCMSLGYFHNEIEAAHAYDIAAFAYFGDFAKTNFPEETYL